MAYFNKNPNRWISSIELKEKFGIGNLMAMLKKLRKYNFIYKKRIFQKHPKAKNESHYHISYFKKVPEGRKVELRTFKDDLLQ